MKTKRMRLIAGILAAMLLVMCCAGIGIRCIRNANEKDAFLSACGEHVRNDITTFAKGYYAVADGQVCMPFNDQDTMVIATTVSKTVRENYAANNLNNADIKSLELAVDKSLADQLSVMGITMTMEQYQAFLSGIKAVVTADLFKAVSERGLTNTEDLDILRAGLEQHLATYEAQLSAQSQAIDASAHDMDKLLSALSVDRNGSLDANLSALLNDLSSVRTLLANVEAGRYLAQKSQDSLLAMLDSLENRIILAEDAISTLDDDALRASIDEIRSSIKSEHALTESNLSNLNILLDGLEDDMSDAISQNTAMIESIGTDLSILTGDFNSALSNYEITQANMNSILEAMQSDLGEGSVDERLMDLCNSLAEALATNLSETDKLVSSSLDQLKGSINQIEGNLAGESTRLTALVDLVDSTILSLRKSIESGDSANVAQLEALLSSLNETKDQLSDKDTLLADTINSAISDLNAAISAGDAQSADDISALTDSLKEAKDSLTESLYSLESRQNSALTAAISELNSVIAAGEDADTQAREELLQKLNDVKVELSETDTKLSDSLSNAITELQSVIATGDAMTSEEVQRLNETLSTAKSGLEDNLNVLKEEQQAALDAAIAKLDTAISAGESHTAEEMEALVSSLNEAKSQLSLKDDALNDSLNSAISELEVAIASSDELTAEQVKALSTTLSSTKSDLETRLSDLESRQSAALTSAIDSLSSDTDTKFGTLKTETTASIDALMQAKNNLSTQLSTLSTTVGNAVTSINILQMDLSSLTSNVSLISSDLSLLESNMANVSKDVEDLTSATSSQGKEIDTLKSSKADLTTLTRAVNDLKAAIESGDTTTDQKYAQLVNNINTQLAALGENDTTISGDLADAILELTEKISTGDTKVSTDLQQSIDTLNQNVSALQSAGSSSSANITRLQNKVQALEEELTDKVTYSVEDGVNTITIH